MTSERYAKDNIKNLRKHIIKNRFLNAIIVICLLCSAFFAGRSLLESYFTTTANNKIIAAYDNNLENARISWLEKVISTTPVDESTQKSQNIAITNNMLGVLSIPDLKIQEPIFRGATELNLINGVATIEDHGSLDDQNVAIGGHSVQGVDIRFYNLNKVKKDMIVEIRNKTHIRKYKVVDIYDVKPTAVEVLEQKPNEPKELTLITCDGYNPSNGVWETRLIVKGQLVEENLIVKE